MYVKPYEEPLMQFSEYKAHKLLLVYVPPLLLVLGTFGNLLSFCVLMRKAMRRTSTYNYLAVLSVTDMLVLYIGLLRLWLGELTGYDVRDQSDWSCKIISMIGYTVSIYSVWLLIAVTVERYIVVVHSLHAPSMCTPSRAVKTILFILFIILSVNVHFLFTTDIVQYENGDGESTIPQCDAAEGHEELIIDIWPWVDACLYSMLPSLLISILNILIIWKVIAARSARQSMSTSSNANGRSSIESSAKVTVMLLTISFFFLVTTLPMNITMITMAVTTSEDTTIEVALKFRLARTVSELLMYTNHSVNFYLYLLTGQKFRQQLCRVIGCMGGVGNRWTGSSGAYTQVTHTENTLSAGKDQSSELSVIRHVFKDEDKEAILQT